MPLDQNQDHAFDPLHPPSQPSSQPQQPGQAQTKPTVGGMKIIQPTQTSTTSADTVNPLHDTSPTPVKPAIVAPSATYPEAQPQPLINNHAGAQNTQLLTREDFEREANKGSKRKLYAILMTFILIIILGAAGGFYYSYSLSDHSMYAKLTGENYNLNGLRISYSYPTIMTSTLQNQAVLVAHYYTISGTERALVGLGYIPYGNALSAIGVSSSQALTQIRTKSGSFVDAINHTNPNTFNTLYGDCTKALTATDGQTDDLCIGSQPNNASYTEARVIGEDTSNQYVLTLLMPTTVWTAHQKVWQKIEKSFNYQ